jgi:hypothetical protein
LAVARKRDNPSGRNVNSASQPFAASAVETDLVEGNPANDRSQEMAIEEMPASPAKLGRSPITC